MIEAYPLYWPNSWKRTRDSERVSARFTTTFDKARKNLLRQIAMLRSERWHAVRDVVISTNQPLRLDGEPFAARRIIDDPGVAVYFEYGEREMCFACDQYLHLRDNIHAVGLTIDALRGIERWGASDMMERAFTGFVQLPAPDGDSWWDVLQCGQRSPLGDVEAQYRVLAKEAHPDRGGTDEKMYRLNRARRQARDELGG